MSDYKDLYESLCGKYNRLCNTYDDLKDELHKTNSKLDSSERKIKTELEPRIKTEQRQYDSFVTNGGGDECFSNGMGGNCNENCSLFGSKTECFIDISNDEIVRMCIDDGSDFTDELEYRDDKDSLLKVYNYWLYALNKKHDEDKSKIESNINELLKEQDHGKRNL